MGTPFFRMLAGHISDETRVRVMHAAISWHQQAAARRAYKLRNRSAHIEAPNYLRTGKMLCGQNEAPVRIEAKHRSNPANKCCLKCKRIADRLNS